MTTANADEIENVEPVVEAEEEKNATDEPPAAERSGTEVPTNFANIFSNDDSVDEVLGAPTEVSETTELEEKKEIDEEEHR